MGPARCGCSTPRRSSSSPPRRTLALRRLPPAPPCAPRAPATPTCCSSPRRRHPGPHPARRARRSAARRYGHLGPWAGCAAWTPSADPGGARFGARRRRGRGRGGLRHRDWAVLSLGWASGARPRVRGDLGPVPICSLVLWASASSSEPVRLGNNNGPRVFHWRCLRARPLADFKPAKAQNPGSELGVVSVAI